MKANIIKKGFTLIETLVYLAIFGMIFTVIMQFALYMVENNRVVATRKELGDIIILLNSNIEESARKASGINTNASIFNTDTGQLSLNMINGTTNSYYISNNGIVISRNGIINRLTSDSFTCTKFLIQIITIGGIVGGARVTFRCESVKISRVFTEITTNYSISI